MEAVLHQQKSTNVRALPVAPAIVRRGVGLLSAISPATAASFMARLFMRPPPPRRLQPDAALALQSALRARLVVGDHRLTAWRWGSSSKRVLLVHGWGGRGSQLLPFVHPLLARGFEIWMIDTPAHGDSPGRALTLPQKAALLRETAVQLGGIHGLIAHSFGATAAAVASRDGAIAARLGLIAPPGDMVHFTRLLADALGFSRRVHDLMVERFQARHDLRFDDLRVDAQPMEQPAPTLIVHDEDDLSVPIDHAVRLHNAWTGARLLRTNGLGHKGVLRDPGVVDEMVRFVSD